MKWLFFSTILLVAFACSNNESDNKLPLLNPDSLAVTQKPATDSIPLTEAYITGKWKLVWVTADSLKISPKARKKLMNAKVFFIFNADKSLQISNNKKNVEGTWFIKENELCVRYKEAKNDQCTQVDISDENKFTFVFHYNKEIDADVTLSRVP